MYIDVFDIKTAETKTCQILVLFLSHLFFGAEKLTKSFGWY
jgi:hypothetical protein